MRVLLKPSDSSPNPLNTLNLLWHFCSSCFLFFHSAEITDIGDIWKVFECACKRFWKVFVLFGLYSDLSSVTLKFGCPVVTTHYSNATDRFRSNVVANWTTIWKLNWFFKQEKSLFTQCPGSMWLQILLHRCSCKVAR